MNHLKLLTIVLVVAAALVGLYFVSTGEAEAQALASKGRFVYSAKFLCGEFFGPSGLDREGPVKPGNYQTAINVLNPNSETLSFRKKAILLFDSSNPPDAFELPQPPGDLVSASLPSNWGLEIDCADIRRVLLGQLPVPGVPLPFIKGWVEISAPGSLGSRLNVTAAYTAHGFRESMTGSVTGTCDSATGLCTTGNLGAPCTVDSDCDLAGGTVREPEGFSMQVLPILSKRAS